MRIILMFLFISCFSLSKLSAQEKKWLDANENSTTKEKAVYYRVFSKDKKEQQLVVDFYISGEKAKEVYFIEGKKQGKYVQFYTTGEVETTGVFENGLRDGMWKMYSKRGKIKEKGKYVKGEKTGVWKTFYKNN